MTPQYLYPFWTLPPILASLLALPAQGGEFTKFLPPDTSIVVSVNVRQFLNEPSIQQSAAVQTILEAHRLTRRGNEQELKKFYQALGLKAGGMTEKELEQHLSDARKLKTFYDSLDLDPFRDIDRITFGIRVPEVSCIIIVEGNFKPAKFKAAAPEPVKKGGLFKNAEAAGFLLCQWSDPHQPGIREYVAVTRKVMVVSPSEKWLAEALDQAVLKKKETLPQGMRTLLARVEKDHLAFVINSCNCLLPAIKQGLKLQQPSGNDWIGTWLWKQSTTWLEKFGQDIAVASVGLSFGADDFQLQLGLETTSRRVASELRSCIRRANFAVGLLCSVSDEPARLFLDVLRKERITVQDSALFIDVPISYTFVKKVAKGPWP